MSHVALTSQVPPHDSNAERSVLGAVFLDNKVINDAMQYLQPADFYHRAYQILYHAMIDLNSNGHGIDAVTISDYLKAHHYLEDVGGMKTIANLVQSVPTIANVKYYIKIVHDKAITRHLISAAGKIAQSGYSQNQDVDQMLNNAETQILDISHEKNDSGFQPIGNLLNQAFDHISLLSKSHNDVTGLSTGYRALDKLTTGLHKGEFIIVAARPAMGKTTFALNVAQNVATKTNSTVAIFSLEMGAESLIDRMICSEGSINANHLRTGDLSEDEWNSVMVAMESLKKTHVYIDDTPGINISSIMARSRRLSEETGNLSLIVVDYLQLVEGNDKENRQQEVSEISRELKKLAKELNVPVIALSQLSRSVEQREDKRPVLSDIRESGSIEQDADIVSFLYRKDYYQRGKDDDQNQNHADSDVSDTEVILEKNRSGPRGTIHLLFIKSHNKFSSIARPPINDGAENDGNANDYEGKF